MTEGFAVPAGEVYQAIESPRGEMGYYVVSDGTAKPYRVHMRNPSFATLQAVDKMCAGRLLADVVAVIGSIDIVLGRDRPVTQHPWPIRWILESRVSCGIPSSRFSAATPRRTG